MFVYFLVLVLFPFSLFGTIQFKNCPAELEPAVRKIYLLPEARALIEKASQEGEITLATMSKKKIGFQGLWEAETRTIYVNSNRNIDKIVQTILFELHNAQSNSSFELLWGDARLGRIDKESFVERAERLEHHHLLKTQALIERGIAKGILSHDSTLSFSKQFDQYYSTQQQRGHSQWFSKEFDRTCPMHMRKPYLGTIGVVPRFDHF